MKTASSGFLILSSRPAIIRVGASIVQRPFHTKKSCTACGVIFKREEGFFVGAIMANVVATEVLILLVYFASLLLTNFDEQITLSILFVIGVSFPLVFYHHSWSLWLGMDHLIEMSDKLQLVADSIEHETLRQRQAEAYRTIRTVDVWPSPVVTQLKQGVNESLTFDLMAMSR